VLQGARAPVTARKMGANEGRRPRRASAGAPGWPWASLKGVLRNLGAARRVHRGTAGAEKRLAARPPTPWGVPRVAGPAPAPPQRRGPAPQVASPQRRAARQLGRAAAAGGRPRRGGGAAQTSALAATFPSGAPLEGMGAFFTTRLHSQCWSGGRRSDHGARGQAAGLPEQFSGGAWSTIAATGPGNGREAGTPAAVQLRRCDPSAPA
jgi:hypothetical protein